MNKAMLKHTVAILSSVAAISGCAIASSAPAVAAMVSRSVDVDAAPADVWAAIGPYCAIKNWLPPVGSCTEDGKTPPTRTLVTKDGKATFVELQTARSDKDFSYSYSFLSAPLPLKNYSATIKVVPMAGGRSTVIWSGSFTPDSGKTSVARDALEGIYEAGLSTIKARFAQ